MKRILISALLIVSMLLPAVPAVNNKQFKTVKPASVKHTNTCLYIFQSCGFHHAFKIKYIS